MMDHGGDWTGTLLDFSVNVSPLGVPEGVRRALAAAAERADRYPDPLCRRLRAALSAAEGVPEEWILCGSGAADLLYRAALALRPRRALVTAPAFSEYERAVRAAGGAVISHALREESGFRLDETYFASLSQADAAFLCQPNNPTGVPVPRALLGSIAECCRQRGIPLLLDECFLPFLDDPGSYDMKAYLKSCPKLLIFRAFTKIYALAGVRLGYVLCADRDLLQAMADCGQPWGVSSLAQEAGLAALREEDYLRRVRRLISEERPRLTKALGALGLKVLPGAANFLLFKSPVPLDAPLRQRGILLRSCESFSGLGANWYRTAVRKMEENDALVRALGEVLS